MARIISIHEYELRPDVDTARFERSLRDADARGLLRLPGLLEHHFVKGARGVRRGAYAAVWVYESREAWEHLWGRAEHPRRPEEYPKTWKTWEQEVLAPFLTGDPDAIRFTAYEELERDPPEIASVPGDGFRAVDVHDLPWRPSTVIPGAFVKDIAVTDGWEMQLVRVERGTRFPVHTHEGPEFLFILEGELVQGGRRMGPGWARVARAGTVDEDVHSETGCLFVLVDHA